MWRKNGTGKDFSATGADQSQRGTQPEEGLEETLTLHRLGVRGLLRQTLASTNPIESCFSIVEKVA
jgi:hypothetical protein